MARQALDNVDHSPHVRRALSTPVTQGSSDPSERREFPPSSGRHGPLCLTIERLNLDATVLPRRVIDTAHMKKRLQFTTVFTI